MQKKEYLLIQKTLEKVEVPEKKSIIYKSSKEWKNKINEKKKNKLFIACDTKN